MHYDHYLIYQVLILHYHQILMVHYYCHDYLLNIVYAMYMYIYSVMTSLLQSFHVQ